MRRYFLVLALVCGAGFAADVPTDDEAFTKFVAERLATELPDYTVAPTGKLTLEGKRSDGDSTGTLSLDRIHAYCARNAQQCDAAVVRYSKQIAGVIKDRDRPIEPGMVRLAIRPAAYASQVSKQISASGGAMYYRVVAPGLASIAVLDFAHALRYVNNKDLVKLGLSEQQVFQLGESNLRTTVKPLSEVAPTPGPNSFGTITGEDYASSRILQHDDWKPLSVQLHDSLVVLIPAPNVLLYGDGSTSVGLDAIRTYAARVARGSDHPLPLVTLKWTELGWDVVN